MNDWFTKNSPYVTMEIGAFLEETVSTAGCTTLCYILLSCGIIRPNVGSSKRLGKHGEFLLKERFSRALRRMFCFFQPLW